MKMLKDIDLHRGSITVADCRQRDMPLIYVNQGFEQFSGYSREEVLGRNCRFLQGTQTLQSSIHVMRHAISTGSPCVVDLVNFRKDGQRFVNRLSLRPVMAEDGAVVFYIGVQVDITDLIQIEDRLTAYLRTSLKLPDALDAKTSGGSYYL